MDWVFRKGAHGFHQLLALPSDGNVQPGQSLCHGPPALLWPQKHLFPSHVSNLPVCCPSAPRGGAGAFSLRLSWPETHLQAQTFDGV